MAPTPPSSSRKKPRIEFPEKPELASLVAILAENGSLSGNDLEALALTCKNLHKTITLVPDTSDDGLWRSVCNWEYPCTKDLDPSGVVARMGGYRKLYHQWRATPILHDGELGPMPPPSCSINDLTFFFQLKFKGKVIVSHTVTHDELDDFVQTGKIHVVLPEPKGFCSPRDRLVGNEWVIEAEDVRKEDFHCTIHMLRSSDGAFLCLVDKPTAHKILRLPSAIDASQLDRFASSHQFLNFCMFSSQDETYGTGSVYLHCDKLRTHALKKTALGSAINRRLKDLSLGMTNSIVLDCLEGVAPLTLAVSEFTILFEVFAAHENYLELPLEETDWDERSTGFTILHFLSELE